MCLNSIFKLYISNLLSTLQQASKIHIPKALAFRGIQLNSKYGRRVQALAPAIALAALLIVTMIFENAAPPAIVNSEPENGADCYCHKGLNSELSVNGTAVDVYYPKVKAGTNFTLLISAQFHPPRPIAEIWYLRSWDSA